MLFRELGKKKADLLYICVAKVLLAMIEYVRGKLTELEPTMATVECMGVGYGVNISLNTYSAISGKEEVKLWVYESIREDAFQLWGFATRIERSLFLELITVSGIGAAIARMILSAMSPSELCSVIAEGDVKMLKRVKGIGPKAAERIIVDLKDKILPYAAEAGMAGVTGGNGGTTVVDGVVLDEAVQALTMLGFSPAPTAKAVRAILHEDPGAPVEKVIKLALKSL